MLASRSEEQSSYACILKLNKSFLWQNKIMENSVCSLERIEFRPAFLLMLIKNNLR